MGALPLLDRADAGAFVDALPSGVLRVLAGLTPGQLAAWLEPAGVRRPVVHLPLPSGGSTEVMIEAALSGLAAAAAEIWPFWWDGQDLSEVGGDALGAMHLPLRLRKVAREVPALATGWAKEAVARLVRGRRPRVRDALPELEAEQLCLALAPAGLVLAVACGASVAPRQVAVLEWLARATAAAVLVLADDAQRFVPPLDRILYGGRRAAVGTTPRLDPSGHAHRRPEPEDDDGPAATAVLARPEILGRPHPLSVVEQRMAKLISADPELGPLFACNREVAGLRGPRARVDLVWSAGRVVVEFDGDEHSRALYRADRHRDYELLCAGYLVLRITNGEVIEDAMAAREKIRDVVRLRSRREETR